MDKKYITSFPKNEDWRYLRDREGLLDQYADSLKIFLDEDIEAQHFRQVLGDLL